MSKDAINDVAFNWWRGRKRLQCSNREDEKVLYWRSRRERDCFNRREKLDNALQLNCQKERWQRTALDVIIYRFYTMFSILFLHSVLWVQPVRQIPSFSRERSHLCRDASCFAVESANVFFLRRFYLGSRKWAFTWRVSGENKFCKAWCLIGTPSSPPSGKWNVSLCLNLLRSVARGVLGCSLTPPPFVCHVLSK